LMMKAAESTQAHSWQKFGQGQRLFGGGRNSGNGFYPERRVKTISSAERVARDLLSGSLGDCSTSGLRHAKEVSHCARVCLKFSKLHQNEGDVGRAVPIEIAS